MKIILNKCFSGAFELSPLAVKLWTELSGKNCYFYTDVKMDIKEYH